MSLKQLLEKLKGGAGSGNFNHGGIPGKVGGSMPKGSGHISAHLDKGARYDYIDMLPNLKLPPNLTSDIAKKSGVDSKKVYAMVDEMLATAGEGYLYNSIQESASKAFNVKLPQYFKDKKVQIEAEAERLKSKGLVKRAAIELDTAGTTDDERQKVLKTIYNKTQESLSKLGYKKGDTITLYRGSNYEGEGNPLQSWTGSKKVAEGYARGEFQGPFYEGSKTGRVIERKVPIQKIFSTYGTGFGEPRSQEFVILGD